MIKSATDYLIAVTGLSFDQLNSLYSNTLSTVTFVFGLVLLFLTWRNIRMMRLQTELQAKLSVSQTRQQLIDAHREIFSLLLADEKLLGLLVQGEVTTEDAKKTLLSTILLNHAYRNYLERIVNFPRPEDMESTDADIAELFQFDLIRAQWSNLKKYHDSDFVDYMELILHRHEKP